MPHFPDPVTATLEYVDAHGIETRRTVDIYQTTKLNRHTEIRGFCHGRQEERTFRSDRLRAVIDEHGEVLSASEFLARLSPHKSKEVEMMDIAPALKARIDSPDNKKAGTWGTTIFLFSLSPAILMAAGGIFLEGDPWFAAIAFVLLATPVFVARWLFRTVRKRLKW